MSIGAACLLIAFYLWKIKPEIDRRHAEHMARLDAIALHAEWGAQCAYDHFMWVRERS